MTHGIRFFQLLWTIDLSQCRFRCPCDEAC
ncbi:CRISPR-associated DxTHG motif protein [Metaplanococcus flavidus]